MKIRCSAIGKIMTNPRSKGEVLSQTTKSYIKELVLEHKYGIRKEINSRYLDKGNIVENESIELTEKVLDLDLIVKNESYFENDFICGTPDIIMGDTIIDVKSSWSAHTFPFFLDEELPNKDYYYQLQGYMALTGATKGMVVYCLINTPEEIVLDEIRRTSWSRHELDVTDETEAEVRQQHEFDHIPEVNRVKAYYIDRDEDVIKAIYDRVKECRTYYQELWQKI
jgi:hypothetical protein